MRTLFEKNMEMDMDGVQTSLFDRPTQQYRNILDREDIPNPVDLLHIRREDVEPMSFHTSVNWTIDPSKYITRSTRVKMIDIHPNGGILLHCWMHGSSKVMYVFNDINIVKYIMDEYKDYTYLQRDILVPRWMIGESRRILAGENI